ncbi:probable disease resistance protein At5g66900 [Nicotiana tomentosiformis]|uniref:probable disease resistance protein At5g66900 n=1 Tax=Nicotiana tomentosiformis TaxID=4098 RepID=UPI00051BB4D1|nr:probable disease resistance protein At5g66900 [Nicotiana tomentosiformis]
MAASLLGGAALGPVFDILLKAVLDVGIKIATFRSKFKSLTNTLNDIKPVFDDIEKLNKALDGREYEIEMFKKQLLAGEELVRKCSKTKCYDALKKWNYSRKLTKLENSLVRFFQVHGFIQVCRDSKIILVNVIEHGKKLDQISSMLRDFSLKNGSSIGFTNSNGSSGWMNGKSFGSSNGNGFSGWSDVPQVSDCVVGFDLPLQELKVKLLEEKEQVVVLSAPAGCGKTTLAAMVCLEDDIKAKYRDIFFVTVSKTANIKRIVGEIFEMKGYKGPNFASEHAAICQLNNLLRRSTSQPVLLVLDDVWSESDFVIESFIFQIPGFKILVTSRSVFPKFDTYKLNLLSEKDAKALFYSSAFKDSIPNVRLDLVHKVVRSCCGFPLALKVVGRSLCGQPELIWFNRVMLQSKRQILFPTENDLLRTLRASIDALDEIDLYSSDATTLRDCYLDLGSFPEDHRIHAAALLDMWVERYNLDEDGMKAMTIFFQLSSQNLVNLALARKDAPAVLGLHNLHYIQQHDLLRELVIHQCDEKPVEERRRLYINIKGNDFPKWWFQQRLQPLQAEVLSIFTDEDFATDWYDVQFPKVEVLVLNFETKTYNLPPFVEQMSQLKTLIVTNNCFFPAKLNNFQLCSLLNLKRISLERISVTSIFTANLQLPNLRKISFIMCEIGEAFENPAANMSYMWPKLVEMNIEYCNDLVEVPAEICDLVDLKKLSICYCHELVALPKELGKLTNLEVLRLHSCTNLSKLPKSVVKLNRLGFLDVYDCVELDFLPTEMDQLCSLRTICMGSRLGFTELPNSVLRLVKLEDVACDEETASLWEYYKEHMRNLRITVIKEDINLNLLHKSLFV